MNNKVNSIYIHFPFCNKICNYCDFFKSVPSDLKSSVSQFENNLLEQWKKHSEFMSQNKMSFGEIDTLYIGGGTPSLWGESGARFIERLKNQLGLSFSKDCEFTLEVNPGGWSKESISSFESVGVNRYSIGIQSLNAKTISFLDRFHSLEDSYETMDFFKNKNNFSLDLMIGLPETSGRLDLEKEMEKLVSYHPHHLSVYILGVKSNYKYFKELPSDEIIEAEYLLVSDFLRSKGFEHYEVSNFAKPGYESRHNQKYWELNSVAALGESATGYFTEVGVRYKWKYGLEFDVEVLDDGQKKMEKLYMNIRTSRGIKKSMLGPKEWDLFSSLASKKWVPLNLATVSEEKVSLTAKGFLILDTLMDDLFRLGIC